MITRRTLLQAIPAIAAPAAGILLAGKLKAQPRTIPHSRAIVKRTAATLVRAARNPRNNLFIEAAAVSLETYFAHMDEIGFTPIMDNWLKTSGVLDAPLSPDQAATIAGAVEDQTGIVLDPGWYTTQPVIFAQFQKAVADVGAVGMNAGLVATLHQMAEHMPGPNRAGIQVENADVWWTCMGLAIGGLYTSVWGYMGTLEIIEMTAFWEVTLAAIGLWSAFAGILCA
jgi:hypothetical protein